MFTPGIFGGPPPKKLTVVPQTFATLCVPYTNFDDHRLRGFWVARGPIFPSPIDCHHRPYNTLALQCGCVIHRETEKRNQFSVVCIFFNARQRLVNFVTYIKESISYNSV